MTRPIPLEVQESIKAFFSQSWSLHTIQKIFPDLSLSVLSRYRKKFFDGPKGVQCCLSYIGIQMSMRNIRYILIRKGFKPKRKVKTNFVRAENRAKRLAWTKRHRHLTTDDWRKWGFSDKTRINMWGSDGKAFYWTDRPTELLPHQTEAQVQGDGSGVVFWGMITAEGLSYGSTITERTVNSEVYAEILELSLQDTMACYGFDKKTFRFQQDHILSVLLRDGGSDATGTL
ncbi:hypothetical protein INT46_009100 [Mucor plumbeus]|uniref:Transposase Tc1-like domain-containing protein n=1 Tax=Mucor plumbeus TaxID=97098 RepID=A0A8H7QRW3_9FUNG|nr:hypothetical protein INT46_009100 [Mucor plumbeus]